MNNQIISEQYSNFSQHLFFTSHQCQHKLKTGNSDNCVVYRSCLCGYYERSKQTCQYCGKRLLFQLTSVELLGYLELSAIVLKPAECGGYICPYLCYYIFRMGYSVTSQQDGQIKVMFEHSCNIKVAIPNAICDFRCLFLSVKPQQR